MKYLSSIHALKSCRLKKGIMVGSRIYSKNALNCHAFDLDLNGKLLIAGFASRWSRKTPTNDVIRLFFDETENLKGYLARIEMDGNVEDREEARANAASARKSGGAVVGSG